MNAQDAFHSAIDINETNFRLPGDVLAARQALSRGGNIHALDEHNVTPLLHAVRDQDCHLNPFVHPISRHSHGVEVAFEFGLTWKRFCLLLPAFVNARVYLCSHSALVGLGACCPCVVRVRSTGDGGLSTKVRR